MLTYDLSKKGNLYENLYKGIKDDILNGKLKYNDKLPSKRTLSLHLKVSKVTIENAYFRLMEEGYIYSVEKKGYYVEKIDVINNPKPAAEYVHEENKQVNVNSSLFPFSIWSKLTREVILDYNNKLLNPIDSKGVYELRLAIKDYLYSFKGLDVSYNQIIIGSGTEYLYNLLIQLFGRNKGYIIENPGFKKISKIYNNNDVNYEYVNMTNDGIDVNQLYTLKGDILHISLNHHFPTGIISPISKRQEILSWAIKSNNRYIIEDDYDSEFRFLGSPIPPLFGIDKSDKVIYMNTFSKTLAPSIRISYMVLPISLLKEFDLKLGFYSCSVPSFDQYILSRFINDGYFEKNINKLRTFYKNFRTKILNIIYNSKQNDKLKVIENASGLHFLLELKTNKKDSEIRELLKDYPVALLSDYYKEKIDKHTLLIDYSIIDYESFIKLMGKLEGILND